MGLFSHVLSLDKTHFVLSQFSCNDTMPYGHICNSNDCDVDANLSHKRAAVLVIVYGLQHNQDQLEFSNYTASPPLSMSHMRPIVIMTVKSVKMNIHAGEIAFPGGKVESTDTDLLHTALRETHEELGLELRREQVISRLCPVRTRNSGFLIVPFVATLSKRPTMTPNTEVESILEMPLDILLDTISQDTDPAHDATPDMYTFEHSNTRGQKIWGASARILKQIHDILGGKQL